MRKSPAWAPESISQPPTPLQVAARVSPNCLPASRELLLTGPSGAHFPSSLYQHTAPALPTPPPTHTYPSSKELQQGSTDQGPLLGLQEPQGGATGIVLTMESSEPPRLLLPAAQHGAWPGHRPPCGPSITQLQACPRLGLQGGRRQLHAAESGRHTGREYQPRQT